MGAAVEDKEFMKENIQIFHDFIQFTLGNDEITEWVKKSWDFLYYRFL